MLWSLDAFQMIISSAVQCTVFLTPEPRRHSRLHSAVVSDFKPPKAVKTSPHSQLTPAFPSFSYTEPQLWRES
ncbi:hypothetical protein MHYP_G00170520 [Metynnis hypsauchen]